MPRKPVLKKQKVTILVNGTPISVTMTPPSGVRTSWYAYWNGLVASKSTGHADFAEAVKAVDDMLQNGGKKSKLCDAMISDDEFDALQARHFGKRKDEAAQKRAAKSLKDCREALAAFRLITGISPITAATPDDCEQFQENALSRPRNWRQKYPKSKVESASISANTVVKWSRQLQAAFDRANRNAGKKCIRGVVDEAKLLSENPWKQFTWIEGTQNSVRQFDSEELISLLDSFEKNWPQMTVISALAKTFLWSWGRRSEIVSLKWDECRNVGNEFHFNTIGKWGVEKWFRIPEGLFSELQKFRTESPFVFAAYTEQLRQTHSQGSRPYDVRLIGKDFCPDNLGDWFYRRLVEWSELLPRGRAYTHVFRKTALQYARCGEDMNRDVASDARISKEVMMTHYVKETDEELRRASNRTFQRILRSLGTTLASRYGHLENRKSKDELEAILTTATAEKNWSEVARIATELSEVV